MTKNEKNFFFLFLISVFSASLLQGMIDPDLFWHLRAGNDILEAKKIVLKDSWNYLFEGNPWVNQQWLIQVVFASLYKIGGFSLLFYFKAFLSMLIAFFIFLSIKKDNLIVSYLTTTIILFVIIKYFLMRTQLFSFLFLAILIYFLERIDAKKRFIPLILLFALWANSHAFFGLGLLLLGCYVSAKILYESFKEKSLSPLFIKENLLQIGNIILCVVATLINPFGIKIYQTAFTIFSQKQETLITEWLPVWKYPLISHLNFYFFFILLIFLSIIYLEKIKIEYAAMALPLILFGFFSVRILPFSLIASSPLLSLLVNELFTNIKIKKEQKQRFYPIFLTLLLIFSLSSFSYRLENPITITDTNLREDYPLGAIAFMKENNLKGKIFSQFNWGGFIIFSSKDFKTAIDGRTAVFLFPKGYLEEWRDTVNINLGWKERLERGSPDYVLLRSDDFLATELIQNKDWQMLYGDSISVLFGRKN